MHILPLKSLREDDKLEFGIALVRLAKLKQLGLPVADGLVVSPPIDEVKKLINYIQFITPSADYSHHCGNIEAMLKIALPNELANLAPEVGLNNVEVAWRSILQEWTSQVSKYLHNRSTSKGIPFKKSKILTPQTIFVIKNRLSFGTVYYDFKKDDSVIKLEKGSLTPKQLKYLDEIVIKGNQKLRIPHIYHWILDENQEIKLVKIVPQANLEEADLIGREDTKSEVLTKKLSKSNLKLFLETPVNKINYEITEDAEGFVINGSEAMDFDILVHKLVEVAESFLLNPVFYVLKISEVHLLSKKEIEAFLFTRNKRQLLNVVPVIEKTSSVDEFMELKRDLASFGITRKGSLKLYLQLTTPENLINIKEYILAGVDGVIIHLDQINGSLHGRTHKDLPADQRLYQINTLIKLFEDPIRQLHKNKVSIIFSGSLTFDPDMLKFILDKGAYGVVVNLAESHSLHEYINFLNLKRLPFPGF